MTTGFDLETLLGDYGEHKWKVKVISYFKLSQIWVDLMWATLSWIPLNPTSSLSLSMVGKSHYVHDWHICHQYDHPDSWSMWSPSPNRRWLKSVIWSSTWCSWQWRRDFFLLFHHIQNQDLIIIIIDHLNILLVEMNVRYHNNFIFHQTVSNFISISLLINMITTGSQIWGWQNLDQPNQCKGFRWWSTENPNYKWLIWSMLSICQIWPIRFIWPIQPIWSIWPNQLIWPKQPLWSGDCKFNRSLHHRVER